MEGYEFDLSGGHPCLDFTNTVSERPSGPIERLETYADLLAWSRQSGLLPAGAAARLAAAAPERPEEASRVLARAIDLREALYRLLSALAAGRPPAEADLARLDDELPAALARRRLVRDGGGFAWGWREPAAPEPDLAFPLAPVAAAAASLLTSDDDLSRLRECDADTCGWLFLDRSRNRSRRWCDMAICGNRAKARRHYERQTADA